MLLEGGVAEALDIADGVLSVAPKDVSAHRVRGLCLQTSGRLADAETALRTSLKLDRHDLASILSLADLLDSTGRPAHAERLLRSALEANRRSTDLVVGLSRLLTAGGRPAEALALIGKLQGASAEAHAVLAEQASALKASGQAAKASAVFKRTAALYPDSAVAHHNLAASQGDDGQFAAAARSAARALACGGTAPQTWLVHARALLGCGRLDEAEHAFRQALQRDPAYLDAHRELAQLIWMRTADAGAALASLDAAIRAQPHNHPFLALRAKILQHAGKLAHAYATLQHAVQANPDQPTLWLAAAELAGLNADHAAALGCAEHAARLLPNSDAAEKALFAACVAAGDVARAGGIAEALVRARPTDQRALAFQALAWRLADDPRYAALYDYAAFVRAWQMDVPDGWATLPAYLADLTEALGGLHPFHSHPLDQSVRHGSQATHLLASDNPVIRAFFQSVDGPIRRHLAALGRGADPLRARNTGRYRFDGAWSVRLRPGGFHTDHIHPDGWLSSACYIALPPMGGEGREAWIKFGEPGIPTTPRLGPEHVVQPAPGMLVLFPSYMWHGTVPFTRAGPRLSIAFDLVPG